MVALTGQVPQAMIGKGAFSGNRFFRDDPSRGQTQLPDHGTSMKSRAWSKKPFHIAQTGGPAGGD